MFTLPVKRKNLHLQSDTPFSKLSYTVEELQEQFHTFTSVIESEFVAYNEETFEFLEVTYDE